MSLSRELRTFVVRIAVSSVICLTKPTFSSFDPASLHILSRLNQIISTQDDLLSAIRDVGVQGVQKKSPLGASYMSGSAESDHSTFGATATEDYTLQWSTSASYLKIPSSRTTPDMILVWPILEGKFPIDCLQEAIFDWASYGVESDDENGGFRTNIHRAFESQSVTYGLQEIEVVNLTDRFLSLVHTKNPILDESTLRQFANTIAENGMSWDGPSCLVVSSVPKVLHPF